jgi:type IV secretory pathway TrbF-like protein
MNEMFRLENQPVVHDPEPVVHAHRDWDGRIKRAHAGETAWKRFSWVLFGVLCGSVGWNIHQAGETKIEMVHILHGSTGEVLSVNVANGSSVQPTQAMLAAEMQQWMTNVRTVYIDVMAMRAGITHAYDLIAKGSQADAFLNRFYNQVGKDPFHRALNETVAVRQVEAIPPSPDTIGPDQLQTWDIHWTEDVTSLDGQSVASKVLEAKVTFKVVTPQSWSDAKKNPDGIHILSLSWTE